MKKIKSLISVMLVLAMMLTFAPMSKAANFTQINANNVFLTQPEGSVTCTLYAATMMMRRYSMLRGDSAWATITANSAYKYAWDEGGGLWYNFTYKDSTNNIKDIKVSHSTLPTGEANRNTLISLLQAHPEGVVIYYRGWPHAVLLTDYTAGVFYCADPAKTSGRIPLTQAGSGVTLTNVSDYWYIASERVYLEDVGPHTCDKGTFAGAGGTHPHNSYYYCSICGANWRDWDSTNYLESCAECVNGKYESISTGYYTLTNVGSGSILNISGGADADQTNVTGGTWNPGHQRLYISPASTGYKMKPVCSSRLINAWGENPGDGANVNIYKDCNESSQWWLFEKVSDGYVVHLAYNPSLVLTYWASSNNVAVATYASGDTRQIWKLDPSNEFTVSYDANGGSGAPAAQKMYQGRDTALSSTAPTRNGYTFSGWNTKADGTGTAYAAGGTIVVNANVTLYAQWKSDSYTLTYNANGGTGAPSAQTVTKGNSVVIPSTVPTRDGYTFKCWNVKADGSSDFSCYPGDSVALSGNMTLYAIWETAIYVISYNPNGGTVALTDVLVANGDSVNLSTPTKYVTITYNANGGKNAPSATKAYYECLGWSKSSAATTATYKCGEPYKVNGDVTLYAVWANKAYTDLSSAAPVRDGYNFLGWATSSTATQAQFTPGMNVNLGIDTTLYAVWQKVETPTPPTPSVPTITEQNVSLTYKDNMNFNVPVELETSNSKVASVSENKISAVGAGSADVTATFEDGSVCVYHVNVSYAWWQWIIIIVLFGWIWY